MKRLFWLGLGAAAGYYAARRGDEMVERARERGVVGNVSLAATTASRMAASASRTAASIRTAATSAPSTPADPSSPTREARS
ncbi:MAG: hypothetical protein AB7O74_02130 [Candidatus Nanopelagicales bacterium]